MGLGRVVEGVRPGDPQGQGALVHQPDQLRQPGPVRGDLDRRGAHPARRGGLGLRDDADVRAAVPHPPQGALAEHRRVQHGVEAAPGRLTGRRGGAEGAHEVLVGGPGQAGHGHPAPGGELDGEAADRARRARDQQRPALLQLQQVEGLGGGQRVQRERGRVHGVHRRRRRRDRVGVHHDVLRVRAHRLHHAVVQRHDPVARAPRGGHAGRVHGAGDVPAEPDLLARTAERPGPHPGVDRVERRRGHLDPYLAGGRLGQLALHDLHRLRPAEGPHHGSTHHNSSEDEGT